MSRGGTDSQRNGLKTAVKSLLAEIGGVDAGALVTRVARSNLANYGSVHMPDAHMPIDVVLDLELTAESPIVTAMLAAALGYALIPLAVGEGDVAEALAAVSADAGVTLADGVRALRGGSTAMTEAERAALVADLTELSTAVSRALGLLSGRPPPSVVSLSRV